MRAGLSTIQQTLTAEAAVVLNGSIAEAGRRGHGQTTPLHVAATLLASPAGLLLRQACVRSHPASSHPLQCRALELCFSVALDRLPSAASAASAEPPISNALMAALKRAQAHQRRGCPEQQQQPLLAVKVELDQLVVSILDDPGVSRVMREASFSSPAVKATIEHSLSSSAPATNPSSPSSLLPLSSRPPSRNLYLNPRLAAAAAADPAAPAPRTTPEAKKVVDILARAKKRNPILVGDSDPDAILRDALRCIESGDAPPALHTARIISVEKELAAADRARVPSKIQEIGDAIPTDGSNVILDLGDLKWLVESPAGPAPAQQQQQQQIISEMGRAAVAEMARVLGKFGGGNCTTRVWLVGTATCATYLRCQVYHPTMETDWDLQAVPVAPRSPLPGLLPRLGGNGILSSSVESLSPSKGLPALTTATIPLRRPAAEINDPVRRTLCPACMESYERELGKLVAREFEKSSSDSRAESRQALPQWLRTAPPSRAAPATNQSKEQELKWKQSTEELLKRWRETCARLHSNLNLAAITADRPPVPVLSVVNSRNSLMLPHQPPQPSLTLSQTPRALKASNHCSLVLNSLERPASPPRSPVRTDLVLGNPDTHKKRVKDFATRCLQDEQRDKIAGIVDVGSFKRLLKGLAEKVVWQPEAASVIANVVMQCKSGNGKRRGSIQKGDTWLLFIGPDRVGKQRMAAALSELVCGTGPITVNLGRRRTDDEDGESDFSFRGKTAVDRVSEAIRQNPFSVMVLEDFDRADVLVRSTITRAMERGRLPDSYGREVSLGSVIFVLTAEWLPDDLKSSQEALLQLEEKILEAANPGWQLELSVGEKAKKRQAEWLCARERHQRPRKESCGAALSLDLNLAAGVDDDANESSRNSSDLTAEHEHDRGRLAVWPSVSSLSSELIDSVDDAIVFKPVDFGPLRRRVLDSMSTKFSLIMGNVRPLQVDDDVLDRMVGSVWISGAATRLDEWTERVFAPSIYQLKSNLKAEEGAVVRLSLLKEGEHKPSSNGGDCLPRTVSIALNRLGVSNLK